MTPATAVATASRTGVSCSISDQPSSGAERHHRDAEDQDQAVHGVLERRARVAELARLAHQALGVGVRPDGGRHVRARRPRRRTSRRAPRRPPRAATGSASPVRIDSSTPRASLRTSLPVGHHLVARAQQHQVARDHLGDGHLHRPAVAHHGRARRHEGRQPVEARLGAGLLHDADAGVQHQDPEEDGVAPVAEDQGDDAEDQQRHVEDREQVRAQDARPRAARRRGLHLAARRQAAARPRAG